MKKAIFTVLLFICIGSMLLFGCSNDNTSPDIRESLVWEGAPTLNFGTMEYEKLKVEPWYCGRSEATGKSYLTETAHGYYLSSYGTLYYADKENLGLWVPVCNQPDCSHSHSWSYGQPRCNARVSSFVLRDGRIYFADMVSTLWEHYSMVSDSDGYCIASRALDGTDLQLAYKNSTMDFRSGGTLSYLLNHEHWLVKISNLNQDGSKTHQLYRVTDAGALLLSEHTTPDTFVYSSLHCEITAYGDQLFFHGLMDENQNLRYRFTDSQLVKYDFTGIGGDGQYYLAGDQMRTYRQNDGYYDMDLTTREQVRVADVQLTNAFSHILLPNCILETTFSYGSYIDTAPCEAHAIKLFNGEAWQDISLPPEVAKSGNIEYMSVAGVTSDSIFLCFGDLRHTIHLYRLPLDTDSPALEFCTKLQ